MPSDHLSSAIVHTTTSGDKTPRRPLSEVLVGIVQDITTPQVSVDDLLVALKDRAFGALILVFAAPNVLPTPPGTSTLLGAPLIFLTAQLALGREVPWLPRLIADRSLSRATFVVLIERLVPWISRAELLLKPRLCVLAKPPAEQLLGVVCLLLAAILILPIPLGNMLPALAICIIAFAVMERDGVASLLGLAVAAVSLSVVWGVVYAFILSAKLALEHVFTL
ncbi:MAG: exopolysaccharide biosynthesis protein [Rhodospirillaceae bacterium]